MGTLDGQVAFITGAARGQGRAHAVRMAAEGADVIAVDLCAPVASVGYPMATEADLAETAALVREQGRRVVTAVADTRDLAALQAAVDAGVEELGRLDVVVANAGIGAAPALSWELSPESFREMMDINVTGVWQTTKVAVPHLLRGRRGGSIVLISSMAGLRGVPGIVHYSTAKHAVRGMAKSLANELGWAGIRVNSVHPGNVRTPMIENEAMYRTFRPDLDAPTLDDIAAPMQKMNLLPEPWVEVDAVTDAVMYLVSSTGRAVTGIALPVDLGTTEKYAGM